MIAFWGILSSVGTCCKGTTFEARGITKCQNRTGNILLLRGVANRSGLLKKLLFKALVNALDRVRAHMNEVLMNRLTQSWLK